MGIEYPAPEKAVYGQLPPSKYVALVAALKTNPDASNVQCTENGSGSVTYQKIDFSWDYDSSAEELTVTIVADHNWKAEIAGNQTIFEMVQDKLLSTL